MGRIREEKLEATNMRVSTGVEGLDSILRGGLLPGRAYLVQGEPGTGKTTLGLHFLATQESGLLITFAQTAEHIRADAASLGLKLDAVRILDLTPPPEVFSEVQIYDIFSPAEVERAPVSREIAKAIEDHQAKRIFVDSLGHFRNLASDVFQRCRIAQSFFRFATQRGATLLVGAEDGECARDVDGVIQLEFSNERRSVRVTKFRGSDFLAGSHPMRLTGAGLQIPVPEGLSAA
jgi:circadian clock protein KaiC